MGLEGWAVRKSKLKAFLGTEVEYGGILHYVKSERGKSCAILRAAKNGLGGAENHARAETEDRLMVIETRPLK